MPSHDIGSPRRTGATQKSRHLRGKHVSPTDAEPVIYDTCTIRTDSEPIIYLYHYTVHTQESWNSPLFRLVSHCYFPSTLISPHHRAGKSEQNSTPRKASGRGKEPWCFTVRLRPERNDTPPPSKSLGEKRKTGPETPTKGEECASNA